MLRYNSCPTLAQNAAERLRNRADVTLKAAESTSSTLFETSQEDKREKRYSKYPKVAKLRGNDGAFGFFFEKV